MIQGSVDALSGERAVGWAYSALTGDALRVQAMIDNQVIGEATADLFRPDLAQAGLGSGHCGFEIRFRDTVDPLYLPFVDIRLSGGTLALPRTSMAGFSDYFSSLYRRYPCVGRHSSVLGGLWTDRSDAAALLKARVDIGTVTQADSGILSRFIQEGLVVVELDQGRQANGVRPGTTPPESDALEDIARASSGAFFHQQTLRVLRSILEDHPIAVRTLRCPLGKQEYVQVSAWDEIPSPTECLGVVVPLVGEDVPVEVLRGSHRFPEFSCDGISRWTTEGQARVAAASLHSNVFTDVFRVPPGGVALIGPGVIHRVAVRSANQAVRLLVLPSRLGVLRFRQQAPAEELAMRCGARLWISDVQG